MSESFFASGPIQEYGLERRPTLLAIEREGVSGGAIAFAAAVQSPPIANYGLALILQSRLARNGVSVEPHPSSFGQSLVFVVANPAEASLATDQLQRALSREITSTDLDSRFIDRVSTEFGAGRDSSPGEIALSRCSGELYRDAHQAAALAEGTTLVRWLNDARARAFSHEHSRFAVVGASAIAVAVRARLMSQKVWPDIGSNNELSEPSHESPAVTVSSSADLALSFAWTTGSLDSAVSAWHALRQPSSPLVAQLGAMDVEWRLDAVSAVARPVGACVRIDLAHYGPATAHADLDLQRVVRLVRQESLSALAHEVGADVLQPSNLLGTDPKVTARRAAWQSISIQKKLVPSLQVHLAASAGVQSELQKSIMTALAVQPAPTIEFRSTTAKGDAQAWMLLASRCAASGESTHNAGATAAWLGATARKFSGERGVFLEPWVSAEGVGLLAHGGGLSRKESYDSIAQRVADALGSALVTATVSGSELAIARENLIVHVGSEPRRAWNLLLEGLSSSKPSTFEPYGNVDSLRYLNPGDVVTSRHRWLTEPLRAAAILGVEGPPHAAIRASIARWLEPHRTSKGICESSDEKPVEQETLITTHSPDELDANAYVAYNLSDTSYTGQEYHEWLEWLLNRQGGWLQRVLVDTGNARAANAYIRGPSGKRVLVIAIYAVDESSASASVARVRSWLGDVAHSGVLSAEAGLARRWAERRSMQAAMDPRDRLVRLWLGTSASPPSTTGFTNYLAQALGSAPVTIMRVHK